MNNVDLFVFDTRPLSLEKLISKLGLNEEELSAFDKYKAEETKKEKLVSFYFKKRFAPDFYVDENGKPQSKSVYFNISHSKGMVVIALNKNHPLGVDIELIRPVEDSLIQYISNDDEYQYIDSQEKFYEVWTSKESLMKCVGVGIKESPKNIPALPLNGVKHYSFSRYQSKIFKLDNFVISLTLESEEEFSILSPIKNHYLVIE